MNFLRSARWSVRFAVLILALLVGHRGDLPVVATL
jgi:hypothetical protein